jgi:hypothetical protein
MFGSEILEVAIGMIFIFLMVSVICSAVREGIEAWFKTRASYLEHGIRQLLNDVNSRGLARSLYEHPLIDGLFAGDYSPGTRGRPSPFTSGGTLPSYIPSRNFAVALLDIAARGPQTTEAATAPSAAVIDLEAIRTNIQNIDNPVVQRILLTAVDSANGELAKAQAHIEAWYDSGMDRVSGWYKRSTQWVILVIALVVAVGLNINTLTIANYLYHSEATRAAVIKQIEGLPTDAGKNVNSDAAKAQLKGLELPIGWPDGFEPLKKANGFEWASLLIGWLLTAFAASMGAPFWFDILNKFMVIRSTVKPHEKSPEEASEDRQLPSDAPPSPPSPPAPPPDDSGGGGGVGPFFRSFVDSGERSTTDESDLALDPEFTVDGCGVKLDAPTADEDLPKAEGGVE